MDFTGDHRTKFNVLHEYHKNKMKIPHFPTLNILSEKNLRKDGKTDISNISFSMLLGP